MMFSFIFTGGRHHQLSTGRAPKQSPTNSPGVRSRSAAKFKISSAHVSSKGRRALVLSNPELTQRVRGESPDRNGTWSPLWGLKLCQRRRDRGSIWPRSPGPVGRRACERTAAVGVAQPFSTEVM